MAFENREVPEDWKTDVIASLYKDKIKEREMNVRTTEVLIC